MATAKRRKLSAKQIKAGFGGKRRKAAAKTSRPKHRARTKKRTNPPRKRAAPKAAPVRRKKRAVAKRKTVKRRNPTPMIISWAAGNPAGGRKVAKKRKKRATAKRTNTAGRRRTTKKVTHRRRGTRRNPGVIGNPMNWVTGGAGVVVGAAGARILPQMLLGASNTGPMGYLANAGAALGLGYLAHMIFPRNPVLTAAVIAGGFGSLISRVITEKSPVLAPLALSGLGDVSLGLGLYQKSNFPYPPRLQGGRPGTPNSSMFTFAEGGQAPSSMASYGSDSSSMC